MSKKRIILVAMLTLLLLVPALVGCAQESPAPETPTPAPTSQPTTPAPQPTTPAAPAPFEWPRSIAIGTHRVGHSLHSVTAAWTPVFEADTGVAMRIVPDGQSIVRRNMLRSGDLMFDINSMSATASDGIEATKNDASKNGGPMQIRLAWSGSAGFLSFMVRGDNPIQTTADVKPGLKVAYREGSSGYLNASKAIAAWCGLNPENEAEVILVPVATSAAMVQAVVDGKADICYTGTSTASILEAAASPHGIRFIEIDPAKEPEASQRFLQYRPTLMFGPVEVGVKEAMGVWGVRAPSPYWAHADNTDNELVYNVVKWIDENYDKYKENDANTIGMTRSNMRTLLDLTYLPVHEGTIKYLKEIGLWTADDENRQAYNQDLLNQYIDAYADAIKKAEAQGLKIDPENDVWIQFWTDYKAEIGIQPFAVQTHIQN